MKQNRKQKPDAQKQEEKKEAHETSAEHHERKKPGPNLQREKNKEKLPKENRTWRKRRRQCKLCKTPNSHKQQTNSCLYQSFYDVKTSIAAPRKTTRQQSYRVPQELLFRNTNPSSNQKKQKPWRRTKGQQSLLPLIKLLQQQTTRSKNTNLSTTMEGNKTSPWQQYHNNDNNKNRRKQFYHGNNNNERGNNTTMATTTTPQSWHQQPIPTTTREEEEKEEKKLKNNGRLWKALPNLLVNPIHTSVHKSGIPFPWK